MFAIETAFTAAIAATLCVLVWRSLTSGRIIEIGPERRYAPISFWIGLF